MTDINRNTEAKLRAMALMDCNILNATPESMFDDICQIASVLCDTPIAFISFFDDTKQLFKSKIGITIDEIPLQDSICFNNLTSSNDFFEISDIRTEARFATNPLLLEIPNIISYCSVAIVNNDGLIVGSLGVIVENESKSIAKEKIFALKKLANQISSLLELKKRDTNLISSNQIVDSKQLENFVRVATHDLKAPLRSIKSFLQLIESKNKDNFDEKDLKYFKFVKDNTVILEDLVFDLSHYVKIDLMHHEIEEIDLNELVPTIFNAINEKTPSLDIVFQCDKLPIIKGSTFEFNIMFHNLLDNALKYHNPQQLKKVNMTYNTNGLEHVFNVIDNGIGISEEYFDTIFLPFKRLHSWSEFPGTGLGLSIVEKVIKKYKGRVNVSSKLGEGSVFTFTIPVK